MRTRQAFPGAVDHVKIPAAHQAGVARKSLPPGGAIRAIRERGDDVPSCGAPRALYGHLQSSYANGIRVSWRGVVSAVEMYASAKFPLTGVYGALASEITRACLLGRLLAWMAWGLFLRAFVTHPWQLRNYLVYLPRARRVKKTAG